ncbi:MAG TPA: polysaccharide deacetylase family protein [Polyangia bacterium]|nr:polysaccharide deacetylase family protein [Polyangia bacterium]
MTHGLSFDVECYRQIHWRKFMGENPRPSQDVVDATNLLLDLLAARNTQATFFVVGSIARAFPSLVSRIVSEGHELGSHGDEHRDVRTLDARGFREELARGQGTLESITGKAVVGYRAPMFSLTADVPFAFETLAHQGFLYDSSIFPFAGPRYGDATAPLGIHRLRSGIFEIPLTVLERGRRRIPALGGGYVRGLPLAYTLWAMRQRIAMGVPAVAYFHPWEFSSASILPDWNDALMHPRSAFRLAWYTLARTPGRGAPMLAKVDRLLRRYAFQPLRRLLETSQVFQEARPVSDVPSALQTGEPGVLR